MKRTELPPPPFGYDIKDGELTVNHIELVIVNKLYKKQPISRHEVEIINSSNKIMYNWGDYHEVCHLRENGIIGTEYSSPNRKMS